MHHSLRLFLLAGMTAIVSSVVAAPPAAVGTAAASSGPISWGALQALPLPTPMPKTAYGKAPQQFGELRLPEGKAPARGWPVAELIHGGCWQSEFDYVYMTRLAASLADAGIASWTIEYRRIGDPDGGWPDTFLDAAAATDYLRVLAKKQPLDLKRVVVAGHSAGGHLALWLAARKQLFGTSMIHTADPLPLRGVVGLAAIADLATYRVGPPGSCNSSVDALIGGSPAARPVRYQEASPMAMLPLGVPQWLVQGEKDPIVPLAGVRNYADAAKRAGDTVTLVTDPGSGHFDVAAPGSPLAVKAISAIVAAAGM